MFFVMAIWCKATPHNTEFYIMPPTSMAKYTKEDTMQKLMYDYRYQYQYNNYNHTVDMICHTYKKRASPKKNVAMIT